MRIKPLPKKLIGKEQEYIACFPTLSDAELGEKFGLTKSSVSSANRFLGLKKSKEYLSKKFGDILREVGKNTRFNESHTPYNKGKKMKDYVSEQMRQKILKTAFKKGNIPYNVKPIGYERFTKDGYIEVKIKHGNDSVKNFKLKQILFYEMFFGKVPEGHNVSFKNGNKADFSIDNLELISKTENLKRNILKPEAIAKRFLGASDENEVKTMINCLPEVIKLKTKVVEYNYNKNKVL